jgi:vacuolar-type H+-ATPase subunit I/STV1
MGILPNNLGDMFIFGYIVLIIAIILCIRKIYIKNKNKESGIERYVILLIFLVIMSFTLPTGIVYGLIIIVYIIGGIITSELGGITFLVGTAILVLGIILVKKMIKSSENDVKTVVGENDIENISQEKDCDDDYINDQIWVCSNCKNINNIFNIKCKKCGKILQQKDEGEMD